MRNSPPLRWPSLLVLSCALLLAPAAQADRFLLVSGGQIEGTLLNKQQSPRTHYEIESKGGAKLVLSAEQVREVQRRRDTELEYERIAPTYADSVEAQWKLAEWCRQQGLKAERALHLRRIIELEPDHVAARHGLGHVQIKGQWTTTRDDKSDQGFQLYRGEWRTAQDIALIEQREKQKLANREWLARLKRWRQAGQFDQIAAVRDASAVPAMCELLKAERDRDAKGIYLDVLGGIASPGAIDALVYITLNDPDVEIFHAAAEIIERLKSANVQSAYLDALKNDNNVRINRAAHMLGVIGDETAISPLIDVLVTTHKVVIGPSGRGATDAMSTGFSSDGGTSYQGGQSTKVFHQTAQNQEVLTALSKLSGVSFGFEVKDWRRWHNSQKANGPRPVLRN